MKKTLPILNSIAFVVMLYVNYLSNTGLINNNTNASVSRQFQNLFTPAGYAFSIWGIIYLFLAVFVVYQSLGLFSKKLNNNTASKMGWWFVVSCGANSLWLFAWLYEQLLLAVVVMLVLLASLIKIHLKNLPCNKKQTLISICCLRLPFSLYLGWIAVALIANIAALLTKTTWNGWGLSQVFWTLTMIGVAFLLNIFMTWKQQLPEFALVGAWALIAIAFANWQQEFMVSLLATGLGITLAMSSLIKIGVSIK